MTDWTNTTDAASLARWLEPAGSIAILTHARPDGDAIGSSFALAAALNRATGTRRAAVLLSGATPRWMDTVAGEVPHHVHTPGGAVPDRFVDADRLVIVDTGSWSQLDELAEFVRSHPAERAIIDHHLNGDAEIADRRLLVTHAAAACEPIAEVCDALLRLGSPATLPKDVAQFIYLGLATDTGWFRHSNVKPATLRLAADLIEAGVDHAWLFSVVEQSEKPARLRIIAAALQSLELIDRDRIAIMTLRTADVHAAHAGPEDTGGLSDLGLRIQTVRVSASITEVETRDGGPHAKISMRSKPGPGMVDVNRVASTLGGGGHANAAGAKLACTVEEARDRLVAALTR
ncbi:MAG: DHH family phosphoesterase [Phycisphaerales bacterium]